MKKKKKKPTIYLCIKSLLLKILFLGKKIIKDMRNLIKLHAYKLFYKPIEKITDKQIKSCTKSIKSIGKRRESLKLNAYLNILLNFARRKIYYK